MSHDLPPPYYTAVETLQPEHRDIASVIKQLSQDIVKTDQNFHDVGTLLRGYPDVEVAPESLKEKWNAHKQSFVKMIWAAREAATAVETRNSSFIELSLPFIGNTSESKEDKIKHLDRFISKQAPEFLRSQESTDKVREIDASIPELLKTYEEAAHKKISDVNTEIARLEAERDKQKEKEQAAVSETQQKRRSWFSLRPAAPPPAPATEHIDYDSQIVEEKSKIEAINKQHEKLKSKLADIRFALNTIPDQVGQCFWTVWSHLTNDATHLRNRLQGSTTDPMPDLSAVKRVYTEINAALKYYATNVNNMR